MVNGTVSVVEMPKPAPAAKKPDAAGNPPGQDEPSIRDKMIDRAINR